MKWTELRRGTRYEFRAANLPGFSWVPFTLIDKQWTGPHGGVLINLGDDGIRYMMVNAVYHLQQGHIRKVQP